MSDIFDELPPTSERPTNGIPIDSVSEAAGGVNLKARRRRGPDETDKLTTTRLPPHSPEAEAGIIGCILNDPPGCIPVCIERLRGAEDTFYDLRHQIIYAHMVQMYDNLKPIDIITLQQRLKTFEQLEQIGGIPYLNQLQDAVPSSSNISYYADIVQEKYLMRRLIAACTSIVERVYDYRGETDVLIDEVERDIMAVAESSVRESGFVKLREKIPDVMSQLERFMERGRTGSLSGLQTGFADLDMMTDGLQPGDMIVIAGRTSMGKTSLAMNIAENIGLQYKIPVGVFSLEMTAESLVMRMITSNARVNLRDMRRGFIADSDYPKITSSAGRLTNAEVFIDDTPGLSILQIRARARRAFQRMGVKCFVIDYMQLIQCTNRNARNREQEIAHISGGIKALAKELRVPIIVLAQLNRSVERENRKPRLSDLRESGAIEQDADVVGLLYRMALAKEDGEDVPEAVAIPVNLLIAKQRNGPTGDVPLTFLRAYTRFESSAKVSDDDVPPPSQTGQQEFLSQPIEED